MRKCSDGSFTSCNAKPHSARCRLSTAKPQAPAPGAPVNMLSPTKTRPTATSSPPSSRPRTNGRDPHHATPHRPTLIFGVIQVSGTCPRRGPAQAAITASKSRSKVSLNVPRFRCRRADLPMTMSAGCATEPVRGAHHLSGPTSAGIGLDQRVHRQIPRDAAEAVRIGERRTGVRQAGRRRERVAQKQAPHRQEAGGALRADGISDSQQMPPDRLRQALAKQGFAPQAPARFDLESCSSASAKSRASLVSLIEPGAPERAREASAVRDISEIPHRRSACA
jgi:hypothetical protein